MIRPICIYGDPVLHERTREVERDSRELQELITDMHETLRNARGIGLAAPQIGRSERVFIVDLTEVSEEEPPGMPMVFINPQIVWEHEEDEESEEGCLSIPGIHEPVIRPAGIRMTYKDRTFASREIEIDGLLARVIQHEYDHLEGTLFIDLIRPFRRSLLKRRLREIARGNVEADYPIAVARQPTA